MADTTIDVAAAIAACNAVVDRIDLGTTNPQGRLRIYDGAKPADTSVAISTQTLLAELLLSNPAFGAAVDAAPGGRATASAITSDSSADASGTATWFRVVDRDSGAVIDGDVSDTGGTGDLKLNSTAISAGAQVSISSWTFTVPEQAA